MKGIFTCFIWVPAHVGGKGNEQVDILAKQALKVLHVDLQVPLSKAEVKSFIRTYAQNTWQEHWGMSETGICTVSKDMYVIGGRWASNVGMKI